MIHWILIVCWHSQHSMRSRVYVTARCPSVCLSVHPLVLFTSGASLPQKVAVTSGIARIWCHGVRRSGRGAKVAEWGRVWGGVSAPQPTRACSGFAAVGLAGRKYWLIAARPAPQHGAPQQMRTVDIGSWTQTCSYFDWCTLHSQLFIDCFLIWRYLLTGHVILLCRLCGYAG